MNRLLDKNWIQLPDFLLLNNLFSASSLHGVVPAVVFDSSLSRPFLLLSYPPLLMSPNTSIAK